MFFPGETITHRFVIPFSSKEIEYVVVSYKQNDGIMLEKTITSDFKAEDMYITSITYTLSQQECLLFEDDMPFTMQVNVYTKGGSRHASHELKSSSGIQYYREIMKEGGE